MTSIIDCRQAIRLLLDSQLDWRIIINERKIVRGVAVWFGEERIFVDEKLRVEGNSWVCGQRRFTPSELVALTEWALTVISKYGAKRYSTRKLKPPAAVNQKGQNRKKISRWEILYADPSENPAPVLT
ncbi:MAG: hypothetical protein OXL36_14950 [Bryobacterales bacterium]|nr:hypothetical protein [Bryobacterales bacterium]MDE0295853.1 hypothetical protein [Bryobacterales bacterium]